MSRSAGHAVAAREAVIRALRSVLPWAAIVAFAVAVLGADYALGKATLVATYAIAGLGVVIVVGQAGQIALGQAALVALGAYAQAVLVRHGVPALLALPAGVAGGGPGGGPPGPAAPRGGGGGLRQGGGPLLPGD